MARIRTIKPEFWSDEKLAPLDPKTRLVFLGLISMADDGGRLLDLIKQIDAFIYGMTNDSARKAVDTLERIGRIKRGKTSSGQPVIQIVNWRHQRIDRPNFAGCLPPIEGDTPEPPSGVGPVPNTRPTLSQRAINAVWSLAKNRCQVCGVECVRKKQDRYDNRPNLGEVDHIVAVADGGTNDESNLQLLCLGCNRTKAGREASARNRGEIEEQSTKPRGTISVSVSGSVPVSTISINDQKSPSPARDDHEARVREALTPFGAIPALNDAIARQPRPPAGFFRQLWSMIDPEDGTQGPGGRPVSPEIVALALVDAETSMAGTWSAAWFRKAIARILHERHEPAGRSNSSEPGPLTDEMIDRWARGDHAA